MAHQHDHLAGPDLVPVRRALLSVSDKTGLLEFARALHDEFRVELISTGGTAKFLRDGGLPVVDVSEVTGFPEMMDGRVKTLHPKIHGGLLALRDHSDHVASMKQHDIISIDLVCINLYPFAQTIARPNVNFEEAIENIDIGGPSMIRSAAKNHRWVLVVTSADRYEKVLGDLRKHDGASCAKHRLKMAERAFATTAEYDAMIGEYLAKRVDASSQPVTEARGPLPDSLTMSMAKKQDLRYGENPHQRAALYVGDETGGPSVAFAKQLHGKELSYINLLDADAALACAMDFNVPAACIVKHATPCGVGSGRDLASAFLGAYQSDPLAAFGGIVALNRTIDLPTALVITSIDKLLEVIVAPSFADDALALLRERWKNVRLLAVGDIPDAEIKRVRPYLFSVRSIAGGFLVQERDEIGIVESEWKTVSRRPPTPREIEDVKLAWLACKHVKSNAIVLARDGATVGIGGGQVDRVGAARIAIEKANTRANGAAAASDAFFPFPDGPKLLIDAGITAIVQPGGSVRDAETIAVVDAADVAMIFTGRRHFRH